MLIEKIKGGLIVSCYASDDINTDMASADTMRRVAVSCVNGGAVAIRTNLENVSEIKKAISVPLIGIKKVPKSDDDFTDFRITPTMKEVKALYEAGVDAIAIDGTCRERYDQLTLKEFIHEIKSTYNLTVIADVSTVEEGINAWKCGADMVGTTLSGYTPYSKNPIVFGTVPSPEPDYEIISELVKNGVEKVIAEGRINNGIHMKKALEAGAYAVVIGTSITEPRKIVKTILYDAQNGD